MEKESKEMVESKSPDEFQAKPVKSMPSEQSVMIISCLNKEVYKKASEIAKKSGVEVVTLEDRVVHDYLAVRDRDGKVEKSLDDFLNNTSNRLNAEDQCVKLWMILTGGKPIENADQRVFTRTEVVRKTNLSHSKAEQLFQLLKVFGMLTFTKGNHEFVLNFSKSKCHDTIKTEILAMIDILNKDIIRYKASINADKDISEKQNAEMYQGLIDAVKGSIEF